jgi:hypothetical protein
MEARVAQDLGSAARPKTTTEEDDETPRKQQDVPHSRRPRRRRAGAAHTLTTSLKGADGTTLRGGRSGRSRRAVACLVLAKEVEN